MYRSPTKCVRKKNIIMFFNQCLRARCPSIFSSIAIEPNVPRDDFSLIAIELTFVVLVQSSMIFVRLGQGRFKSDYITRYLHT